MACCATVRQWLRTGSASLYESGPLVSRRRRMESQSSSACRMPAHWPSNVHTVGQARAHLALGTHRLGPSQGHPAKIRRDHAGALSIRTVRAAAGGRLVEPQPSVSMLLSIRRQVLMATRCRLTCTSRSVNLCFRMRWAGSTLASLLTGRLAAARRFQSSAQTVHRASSRASPRSCSRRSARPSSMAASRRRNSASRQHFSSFTTKIWWICSQKRKSRCGSLRIARTESWSQDSRRARSAALRNSALCWSSPRRAALSEPRVSMCTAPALMH
mmetsp:Transcript_43279/g.80645  ORF Transcript_43279/g.80645 Transcript_43279/m.80645 type:complete len:272 (-) Transcript_43279:3409-4224(-)